MLKYPYRLIDIGKTVLKGINDWKLVSGGELPTCNQEVSHLAVQENGSWNAGWNSSCYVSHTQQQGAFNSWPQDA